MKRNNQKYVVTDKKSLRIMVVAAVLAVFVIIELTTILFGFIFHCGLKEILRQCLEHTVLLTISVAAACIFLWFCSLNQEDRAGITSFNKTRKILFGGAVFLAVSMTGNNIYHSCFSKDAVYLNQCIEMIRNNTKDNTINKAGEYVKYMNINQKLYYILGSGLYHTLDSSLAEDRNEHDFPSYEGDNETIKRVLSVHADMCDTTSAAEIISEMQSTEKKYADDQLKLADIASELGIQVKKLQSVYKESEELLSEINKITFLEKAYTTAHTVCNILAIFYFFLWLVHRSCVKNLIKKGIV